MVLLTQSVKHLGGPTLGAQAAASKRCFGQSTIYPNRRHADDAAGTSPDIQPTPTANADLWRR